LAFRVETEVVTVDDGSGAEVGCLNLLGETTIGIDHIQRSRDGDHEPVEAAIIAELDSGPRPSLDVKESVTKRLGCSTKTVERHAVKMRQREELTIKKSGWPPTSTWALTLGTTPATVIVPNGVPNVRPSSSSGISTLDDDVRDTPRETVPNRHRLPDDRESGYRPACSCVEPVDISDARCGRCFGPVIA
jgi:hypothetical protein